MLRCCGVQVSYVITSPILFCSAHRCEQHWHGILQQESAWADGTAFITQCPIAANDSFLYDFHTGDQAGTFWYHSHLCELLICQKPFRAYSPPATQYCDGLRGAFIVYDPNDPHRYLYDIDDGMLF
jgi:iron transport multicopper oxidase